MLDPAGVVAVAMCIEPGMAGMVLVAPAWSHFSQTAGSRVPLGTIILHCEKDRIVDIVDSRRLVELYGATLIAVGDDHRMKDSSALEALAEGVEWISSRP